MITCGTQIVSGSTGGGASAPAGTGVVTVSSGAFVDPIPSAATTRATLGLGGAAVLAVGTTAGTVAAGDDSRITGAIAASTLTTRGDIITRGASAPQRLALGTSGKVLTSDGTDPVWVTPGGGTPTWLALYDASALYIGGDAAFGFAQADRLSASAAAASPAFGPGQSIVVVLYPGATPTGSEMIVAHTTAGAARGWYVSLGSNAGARTRVGLFFAGLAAGSETSLAGSEAAAGSPYAIAICVKADKSIRYSVNGGAVQTVAALAGSYTAPTSADTLRIGSPSEFAPTYYPLTSALVAAIRCYSTEISDADLVAACANRALGTIPTVASGTVTHDFSAAAFAGGVRTVVASPAPTWISAGGVAIRPKA
jgi:hypothetical protein